MIIFIRHLGVFVKMIGMRIRFKQYYKMGFSYEAKSEKQKKQKRLS